MIIIAEEQKKLLRKYLDNADELIGSGDLYELEIALDSAITEKGFDEDGEWLTEDGLIMQKLYDEIYAQN